MLDETLSLFHSCAFIDSKVMFLLTFPIKIKIKIIGYAVHFEKFGVNLKIKKMAICGQKQPTSFSKHFKYPHCLHGISVAKYVRQKIGHDK